MKRRVAMSLVIGALLLVACGGGDGGDAADGGEPGGEPGGGVPAPPSPTDEDVIEAIYRTDPQLEGGCVWLEPEQGGEDLPGGRLEPLWPEGYQVDREELVLTGPDGEQIARTGDTIRVRGDVAEDVVTICQVGTPFQVTEVLRE